MSAATTYCRAWQITRKDGIALGFTDHDLPLAFDDVIFRPDRGLTASALQSATGLSVDNTEAEGVLGDPDLGQEIVDAGLLDGAEVLCFRVDWQNPSDRKILFRGEIGDLTLKGNRFTAELRSMSEKLNVPTGRLYHRECAAVLGDAMCKVDTRDAAFSTEVVVLALHSGGAVTFDGLGGYASGWFAQGRAEVLEGARQGARSVIKADHGTGQDRLVSLWDDLGLVVGDRVRLIAGCDRMARTCRTKFANFLNFRGFPDIPGEDWLMQVPQRSRFVDGGSLR
ncbi:DUF2163 domain-containing protein [Marivivens sp. LCG002]|uniref:DUF2163 domain-containing protein n=1 Tax=Marivivens sp. LCG002 TaxID=3051171 RepID=UPI0025567A77|nr:DUF2163 domain-containing protein [Marivivens sp. LCG002]WIV49522.1 DUF2163 domain-containing protein [Marivivens sp. LCG002]